MNVAADEGEEKPSRIFVFVQQVTLKPEIYLGIISNFWQKSGLNKWFYIFLEFVCRYL